MPTILPNRASISYNGSGVVLSNETNTNLVNRFTLNVEKDDIAPSVVPGGATVYVVRMDNTGAGVLYNPTFTDDLGNGQLTYIENTALFFLNGDPIEGTATVNSPTELVFTADVTLNEDDRLMVIYAASVSSTQTEDITNTVVGTANGGSETGCEVSDSSDETITVEGSANVSIFKAASEETVSCGDTLIYTFTLMNTGSEAAEDVNFTDALPEQFTVQSVSHTVDDVETPIDAADYTVEAPNTLIIPSAGSSLELDVPAATNEGPATIVITVTGTISA